MCIFRLLNLNTALRQFEGGGSAPNPVSRNESEQRARGGAGGGESRFRAAALRKNIIVAGDFNDPHNGLGRWPFDVAGVGRV